MDIEKFWNIIDTANALTGQGSREEMLKHTENLLSELPAGEIVDWFNIHQHYLKLADRKSIERAAGDCGIYLSDDSFLYFRGWLLSLGKECFYSILNQPETLSKYISSSEDTRFESFVYTGHDIYTETAFQEEFGPDGAELWRQNWLKENPGQGEFGLNWALGNMYSLWDASAKHPLSEEQKEYIRNDLFSRSEGKRIPVQKIGEPTKGIEKVVLDLFPQPKHYRKLSIGLYSGYGYNMLPAGLDAFHQEMKDLFLAAGWTREEPIFASACPEYSKGKSRLYCHPTELSGPCEESLIPEVCATVAKATSCEVTKARDKGRIYDISDKQYTQALESMRPEIERDLLREFGKTNRISDEDRREAVMLNYRIMTLAHPTDTLVSTDPYWKYTEHVLNDLIAKDKIIERPGATNFTSWNLITAPEYREEATSFDSRIQSASNRANEGQSVSRPKPKGPDR